MLRGAGAGPARSVAPGIRAAEEPTAAIIDGRTLRSTPQSDTRADYDSAKRKRGSKVQMAVDTLSYLLAFSRHPGRRQRSNRGQAPRGRHSGCDRPDRQARLRQPGLHGKDGRRCCDGRGYRAARRQAARSQTGLRAAAAALDRGTVLCVGYRVPPAGQGLRAICHNTRRLPRQPIRRIHAQEGRKTDARCMTPSRRRTDGSFAIRLLVG